MRSSMLVPKLPCFTLVFVAVILISSFVFFRNMNWLSDVLLLESFDYNAHRISVDGFCDSGTTEGREDTSTIQRASYPIPKVSWTNSVPETKIIVHVPGFTIFDNLYVLNGTLLIVTSNPELMPELHMITSSGCKLLNGPEETRRRFPTEEDIRVIAPQEAHELFLPLSSSHPSLSSPSQLIHLDTSNFRSTEAEDEEGVIAKANTNGAALRIDGVNWLINDSPQFIPHYYHFVAQMLFGIWRTYSSLDPQIPESGLTALPPPTRLFMTHISASEWRDRAGLNAFVLRGSFPMIGLEFKEDWEDRASMKIPFVFDRVLIADRAASNNGKGYKATRRSGLDPFLELDGSPTFWSTIRNNMLDFSSLRIAAEWASAPDPGRLTERRKHVITYLSRQEWGRRSLRQDHHEKLVLELTHLRDEYGYEVNVVSAENLSKAEQILLAGRTTILMGVHGNGLTALIWMRPSPQATVFEFFYPEGFSYDYESTARALGIKHYGFWENRYFTFPGVPSIPNFPDGFHSNNIPLDGEVVAKLAQQRLSTP